MYNEDFRKNKEDFFFSLKAEVTSANILPMQMSVDLKIATVLLYWIHLTVCNLLNLLVFQQIFSYFKNFFFKFPWLKFWSHCWLCLRQWHQNLKLGVSRWSLRTLWKDFYLKHSIGILRVGSKIEPFFFSLGRNTIK